MADSVHLAKPFCTLEQAALFLGVSYNAAAHLWESNRDRTRAVARDGSAWTPGGNRLMLCGELYRHLDELGRDLFERWQRDDIVLRGLGAHRARDVQVRSLFAGQGA